jgi:hypothetical protein
VLRPGDCRLIRSSLHKRNFRLDNGDCTNDDDYKVLAFEVKENNNGELLVLLPPEDDLDAMIGSSKCEWRNTPVTDLLLASLHRCIVHQADLWRGTSTSRERNRRLILC